MSRKFENKEDDIVTVWNAVTKFKMRRKQVCELMDCTPETADSLYEAGQRRFGRMKNRTPFIRDGVEQTGTPAIFTRPKAEYSNPKYY
jgi:hypothetical protein